MIRPLKWPTSWQHAPLCFTQNAEDRATLIYATNQTWISPHHRDDFDFRNPLNSFMLEILVHFINLVVIQRDQRESSGWTEESPGFLEYKKMGNSSKTKTTLKVRLETPVMWVCQLVPMNTRLREMQLYIRNARITKKSRRIFSWPSFTWPLVNGTWIC